MMRRVYVAESHILPAGHQEDLLVKMTWNRLNNPATDWVFEPKSLRHGVIVARTLLSNHSSSALVRVTNYSDTDHQFVSNHCIGKAEPALAVHLEDVTLRTDHAALTKLRRTPEPLGQQARWLDLLSEFNFGVKHRVGTAHGNNDALSRRPCERDTNDKCLQCNRTLQRTGHIKRVVTRSHATMTGETSNMTMMEDPIGIQQPTNIEEENKFESKPTVVKLEQVSKLSDLLESATEVITDTNKDPVLVPTESDNVFSSAAVRQEQLKDPNVSPILQWKSSSDDRPDWNAVAEKSDETRSYWASLTMENGVLYRKFQSGERETLCLQLIVPENLRHEFVRKSHGGLTGGHFGIRRTQDQVCRRGFWVDWRNYVDRFCKRCPICSQVHRGKPPKQGKLKPLEAYGPLDRLDVDLCGPFPRSKGYNYIMTCVD
jgi:hypothetical protein